MRSGFCLVTLLLVAGVGVSVGEEEPRPLLVTVDDLPVAGGSLYAEPQERQRITRDLLAVLAQHRITAVGLVLWDNVRDEHDVALLELWLQAGHELGNHSASHLSLTRTDADTFIADVETGRVELEQLLQRHESQLRFFRFPLLHEGDSEEKLIAVRAYLQDSHQRNLPVTIDTTDCAFDRPWTEARRRGDRQAMTRVAADYHRALQVAVRHHERRGDQLFGQQVPQILLLHANAIGAAEWHRLFSWLEETGHRFATADEVLADPALAAEHSYVGPRGLGLWDRLAVERWRQQAEEEVIATLQAQEDAWNRGDLQQFCASYADDAIFISPKGITRGRQQVLDRYRGSYPDRAAMGRLALQVLDLRTADGLEESILGDSQPGGVHAVSVVARWTLSAGDGQEPASGLTLLVLHRCNGTWLVVQDASF